MASRARPRIKGHMRLAKSSDEDKSPYLTPAGVFSLGAGIIGAGLAITAVEIASPVLLGVGTVVVAGGAVAKVADTFSRHKRR